VGLLVSSSTSFRPTFLQVLQVANYSDENILEPRIPAAGHARCIRMFAHGRNSYGVASSVLGCCMSISGLALYTLGRLEGEQNRFGRSVVAQVMVIFPHCRQWVLLYLVYFWLLSAVCAIRCDSLARWSTC
jgi:hypothetical protein